LYEPININLILFQWVRVTPGIADKQLAHVYFALETDKGKKVSDLSLVKIDGEWVNFDRSLRMNALVLAN
jgi:hypothetical protein